MELVGACFGCTDVRDVALVHVTSNFKVQIHIYRYNVCFNNFSHIYTQSN